MSVANLEIWEVVVCFADYFIIFLFFIKNVILLMSYIEQDCSTTRICSSFQSHSYDLLLKEVEEKFIPH